MLAVSNVFFILTLLVTFFRLITCQVQIYMTAITFSHLIYLTFSHKLDQNGHKIWYLNKAPPQKLVLEPGTIFRGNALILFTCSLMRRPCSPIRFVCCHSFSSANKILFKIFKIIKCQTFAFGMCKSVDYLPGDELYTQSCTLFAKHFCLQCYLLTNWVSLQKFRVVRRQNRWLQQLVK